VLARTSPRVRGRWMTTTPSRRRAAGLRPLLVCALAASGLVLQVMPAGADTSAPLRPIAESWYRPLPLPVEVPPVPCAPVAGCVVPPVALPATNPYPAKTLHVGASAGAEESRTYVSLDTASVPFGVEILGGTLVLPVLADTTAGTLAPETASIQVCIATAAVTDGVEGSVGGAPAVDCTTSSKAAFAPASASKPASFTVDLKPFSSAIAAGQASLAIVPLVQPGDAGAWHVAFSRRDRAGGSPISATLLLDGEGTVDIPTDPADPGDTDTGSGALPPVGTGSTPGAPFDPSLGAPQQPQTAPLGPQKAGPRTVPVAADFGGPFAYPGVFLLPIVLMVALGWASRAMTRELVPART
jgi:hypothetical protein